MPLSSRILSAQRSVSRLLRFRHPDGKRKHPPSLAPITRLPPELSSGPPRIHPPPPLLLESIGLAPIVRVCRAWNQADIPLLYDRISINNGKSLLLVARTLHSSLDLAQLVSFLTIAHEKGSSLPKPAKRTRIGTPLSKLLAQTISYFKNLYSVTIHDSRLLKFHGTHPPLPPIGFRQSLLQSTLFGHHNLFPLWIEAQDISIDSSQGTEILRTFYSPISTLQLIMNIWMDAYHQFPVLVGLYILTKHNPRVRPSPPTFCVGRASFPSVHTLTLRSNSTELGALVDPTFIEGIDDLIFDIPSPLPLKDATSMHRLTLIHYYTRKHGPALPELPSTIQSLTIDVEIVRSAPKSLDTFFRSFRAASQACGFRGQLKIGVGKIIFHIPPECRARRCRG
ncbi:hypothetical protein NLI96_g6814 [Meripilus lineatus]|uniref:Uncharacterized protein n=1 Tax=Meripilus lineatus TaxID=2056292 RepID=A0AAD5YHR8_9APHY|nr:hypothetical protein NLI96_g6814 [Physisporinus lineatus]